MVQKYKFTHIFKHPFEKTTLCFLRKYPNKEYSHVQFIDTINRKLSKNELVLERVISCKTPFSHICYTLEKTIINAENKTMKIQSQNVNLANIFCIIETCEYKQNEFNENYTTFKQTAKIKSNMNIPFVGKKLETFIINSFNSLSRKGVNIIEELCKL